MNENQKPPIPSREQLHREFAGIIFPGDFNTSGATGCGHRSRTAKERKGVSYATLLRLYY